MNLPVLRSGTEAHTPVSGSGSIDDGHLLDPSPGSSDATVSASAPEIIDGEREIVTQSELRALRNEFLRLQLRHLRDARTKSVSLYILENQVQRVNESLNITMHRFNRCARFFRVNDPVPNLGRLHEAVLNIVDRINLPDPYGDGDSDVETGNNM